VVLHGDPHHFNVLSAVRANWLTIDPKGLLGDRALDVCQFLRNPVEVSVDVNRRRLDIFCAELGLDPRRTRAWCFVHAVLNALWELEAGRPIERDLAYVEQTRAL
jgi:streptomycin 6-kinase